MKFQWLEPTDPVWMLLLDEWSSADIYHLPAYSLATVGKSKDVVRAALVSKGDHRLLVPLILRGIHFGGSNGEDYVDAVSPYGYPGPIMTPMNDDERIQFMSEALSTLSDGLSNAGIVSAFIRLHPFLGLNASDVADYGTTVSHGHTVLIDLTQPEETLWAHTRKGHKYEINRALKRDHQAVYDDRWEHFEDFLSIYDETMRRVGASDSYFFGRDYFVGLREALGPHLHLWTVKIEGDVAAASLFTEYKGILQYHLSGTRTEYLSAQPNKLLLHDVRWWAKARGNWVMHLGGGLGGSRDSLFAFKAGFSKQTCPFYSWRLVTRPDIYRQLTNSRGLDLAVNGNDGFFPAYRRATE